MVAPLVVPSDSGCKFDKSPTCYLPGRFAPPAAWIPRSRRCFALGVRTVCRSSRAACCQTKCRQPVWPAQAKQRRRRGHHIWCQPAARRARSRPPSLDKTDHTKRWNTVPPFRAGKAQKKHKKGKKAPERVNHLGGFLPSGYRRLRTRRARPHSCAAHLTALVTASCAAGSKMLGMM